MVVTEMLCVSYNYLPVELHIETVRNLTIAEGNGSNITAEIFLGTLFRGYAADFTDT